MLKNGFTEPTVLLGTIVMNDDNEMKVLLLYERKQCAVESIPLLLGKGVYPFSERC